MATPIRARGMLNDIARAPLSVHILESMCTSARSWAAWGGRGWLGKTVLLIRHSKILWTVGQRLFVEVFRCALFANRICRCTAVMMSNPVPSIMHVGPRINIISVK